MLKTIDPVLSADLLWILAAMGHGDDIALVDANFPAEKISRASISGRLVRLPGLSLVRAARAILSVLPIDDFVPDPVRRMEVVDDPAALPEVQREIVAELDVVGIGASRLASLERFAFYAAAQASFAVVQVGDPRFYGCFLFRKGVIGGPAPTLP
jgi:L-fucose mutarotase